MEGSDEVALLRIFCAARLCGPCAAAWPDWEAAIVGGE